MTRSTTQEERDYWFGLPDDAIYDTEKFLDFAWRLIDEYQVLVEEQQIMRAVVQEYEKGKK